MNIKYLFGTFIACLLFPILYIQGKRIRKAIPRLPEAKGTSGICEGNNADKTLKVVAIGESTIAGVGVNTHEEGITGTFAKELSKLTRQSVQWKVYARSGFTAQQVRIYLLPTITEQHIDFIIIGLGGNDAFKLRTPVKWQAEIRLIIEQLQAQFPSVKIFFLNMPPIRAFPAFTPLIKCIMGNQVDVLGETLHQTVMQYEHAYYFKNRITIESWIEKFGLQAKTADFFSDGVHPSKLTYQTWAKYTANQVWVKHFQQD